ncbi:hypothetical protein FOPG_10484 [Fusarium oxysporum f. sp. conglutinans race 2 54008]|nr:hypothetical protein FOPG_10484 [Fusarium oxysporum f. sp. conglutinans race 2 54008]KAG6978799.1 1-phosphatidylinositol 4,5-bisphosphate phosphodiesterase 1 [Fusarium oxysporum f. sp. conglutinans]
MDFMSLSARDLSNKCLEAFQLCLTFPTDPGQSSQRAPRDERFEYRLADFNLWIDGIGALAPSKASLDSRLKERQIDLDLVKGNLIMLFQSLEDCVKLLTEKQPLEHALLDIDSALESLATLSLAIRRTGRRSRLHKADRLFKSEEHAELRKHLEAIILLRPGPGPCYTDDEFRKKMKSLTPLQSHLVAANLKRRNRFLQAHLHSLGLKKRGIGVESPAPGVVDKATVTGLISEEEITAAPVSTHTPRQPSKPLPEALSVTSASVPESKLEYKEPISKRTESTPMTVITQITASARYPRPKISSNEQKMVQCPCCCQTLPVSEAKSDKTWRKHLAEDIRPYTCIFDRCPAPNIYYSSRSMLEQHFRQDHPPVWLCPMCDLGSAYSTMTEMMDHLHNTHTQTIEEGISAIISSSAQTRMGVESCPLCEIKGDTDSPELIDHVLEHIHDFSLRSLPWPKSSEVDLGGEVGSFNSEIEEAVTVTQWLGGYQHDTEEIEPTLQRSACDGGRLAIITKQIEAQKQDKLGLDIGFADERGDESAEAETDISQLTQDTLDSVKQPDGDRDVVFCHECSAKWYRDENGLTCPKCQSELVEIADPGNETWYLTTEGTRTGPRLSSELGEDGEHLGHTQASISSAWESNSGLISSHIKIDDTAPQDDQKFAEIIHQTGLSLTAYRILAKLYRQRLGSLIKKKSTFTHFINHVQGEDFVATHGSVSDLESFLKVMASSYMDPLKPLPPKDLTKSISNYFINTSPRALPRPTSKSHTPSYSVHIALIAGCRSIDIDVWNGDHFSTTHTEDLDQEMLHQSSTARTRSTTEALEQLFGSTRAATASKPKASTTTFSKPGQLGSDTEPIVTDSRALMTPCSFREACHLIRNSAFINSDLPVIINLSVRANHNQQEIMVQIMKEEWNQLLIDKPLEGCDPRFRLPKLEDLRGRILVTLSAANPVLLNTPESSILSPSEGDDDEEDISIIQPLAELGVYMRSEPFQGFNTSRAKSPGHVFTLPEGKAQELISDSQTRTDLLQHNQNYFFRVNPKSLKFDTSNPEPLQFWRRGVQMVAVSRHNLDEGMMLNEGMFANESGWVLKPDYYRRANKATSTDLEGAPRKDLELSIFVFPGQDIQWSTNRRIKDLSSLMTASLYIDNKEKVQILKNGPMCTDSDSGALGYTLDFRATSAETNIIPKLSILR